ncbi:MAG: hypothetical protein AD742_04720 [Methylibium sp. NZG]|nr:MAG: hypothetical protein AD742_04720 [Methylibium sp. NZG]
MLRKDWGFDYTAHKLAEAASTKIAFHQERLDWWKAKRATVMSTIRSEGLEIDEKIALEYRHPKSRDWDRGAQVMVRNDLQKDLDECLEKLSHHTTQLQQYDGWQQVLAANPEARLKLDIEDWLFFFASN